MVTIVLIMLSVCSLPESLATSPHFQQPSSRSQERDAGIQVKADTPEQALRTFLVAMATRDENVLREVTLETEDFEWLLKGEAVPAERIDEFTTFMEELEIRTLEGGEEIELPGNRKAIVRPEEVAEDRALLLPKGAPLPTRLRKVEGQWKVDATLVVKGRKAAEAAREKAVQPSP